MIASCSCQRDNRDGDCRFQSPCCSDAPPVAHFPVARDLRLNRKGASRLRAEYMQAGTPCLEAARHARRFFCSSQPEPPQIAGSSLWLSIPSEGSCLRNGAEIDAGFAALSRNGSPAVNPSSDRSLGARRAGRRVPREPAVLASAAPADTTHIDQLLFAR
jgi:hypothetical protein